MKAALLPGAGIGFVGLGKMGVPVAAQLKAAGYRIRAYDESQVARRRFEERTGQAAEPHLSAVACDTAAVILALPDSRAVWSVMIEDRLLFALRAGAAVIDMGSSEPLVTRELAGRAASSAIDMIDAPVSGGVLGAESGSLTVMVGGTEAQFSACRALFDCFATRVIHAGSVGSGHALKALNNLLSATSMAATSEALLIGTRFGLDPKLMLNVINESSGRSYSTEFKFPRFVLSESFDSGFSLHLMAKDVRTAVALGDALDVHASLASRTQALWEQAATALPADVDHTEIARWVSAAGADPSS